MNICQPTNECYNCDEYTGAFECLNKTKFSQMPELSELQMQDYLDRKCSDIIIPVVSKDCEDSPKNYGLSLKQLLENLQGTSIGIRESFPARELKFDGDIAIYELKAFNPHQTKDMQVTYFGHWAAYLGIRNSWFGVSSRFFIDGEQIELKGGYDGTIYSESDPQGYFDLTNASTTPFFYTKVIKPRTYTTIKMEIECTNFPAVSTPQEIIQIKSLQLMITGVTK